MKLIIVLCAVAALALAAPYGGGPKKNHGNDIHNFQGYFPRDYQAHRGKDSYDHYGSDDSDDFDDSFDSESDSDSHSDSDERGNVWNHRPAPGYGGSDDFPAQQIYGSPTNKGYKPQ